jgi:hypothetical protein
MPPLRPSPYPTFFGGTGILVGSVVDAETRKALPGASVFLRLTGSWSGNTGTGGHDEFREVFLTDEGGTFRIEGLVPQRYQIDAEAPGYLRHLATMVEALRQRTVAEERWKRGGPAIDWSVKDGF